MNFLNEGVPNEIIKELSEYGLNITYTVGGVPPIIVGTSLPMQGNKKTIDSLLEKGWIKEQGRIRGGVRYACMKKYL